METLTNDSIDTSSSFEDYGSGPRRLARTEGPLAGVAGGIADYFDVDPTIVRLGIVLGTVLTFPLGAIGYAIAWMVMPEA